MDLEHGVPFVHAHLVKKTVAQDARIVHHHIDTAKVLDRRLDDARSPRSIRYAVGVGGGLTTHGQDLMQHLVGRAGILTLARHGTTQVIDHDFGPFTGHGQRNIAANAPTSARHHDNFVLY